MSGCCLTCATSILPANKAFWSTPTSFATRVTRLAGTEKEQPSKKQGEWGISESRGCFPREAEDFSITIIHFIITYIYKLENASKNMTFVFWVPMILGQTFSWSVLCSHLKAFGHSWKQSFWTSWFHFAIWHADVFALWPSSHASWLGRVAWLTIGCCSVAGYNASLWSMCHVPCLGLHRFCLLCSMECTKVVWQTKAVQWFLSSFMWCWFAMN